MSFLSLETGKDSSQPIELFKFSGSYKNYLFTSSAEPYTYQGLIYEPCAGLERNSLKCVTQEGDSEGLSVEMPTTEPIVLAYAFQITPPELEVELIRVQRETGENVSFWKGKISSIKVDDLVATFTADLRFSILLNSTVPNVIIQPPCNNQLFDRRCKVQRGSYSIRTYIADVQEDYITVQNIGHLGDNWLVGGEIVSPNYNERRMMVAQSGNLVRINYPFSSLSIGDYVEITTGCDRSFYGGCSKYQNWANFGGLPFVPGESNNFFVTGLK